MMQLGRKWGRLPCPPRARSRGELPAQPWEKETLPPRAPAPQGGGRWVTQAVGYPREMGYPVQSRKTIWGRGGKELIKKLISKQG